MFRAKIKKDLFLGLVVLFIALRCSVQDVSANEMEFSPLPTSKIENSINELRQNPILFGYENSDFGVLTVRSAIPCYEYIADKLVLEPFRIIPIYSDDSIFLNAIENYSENSEKSVIQVSQMYTKELEASSSEVLALIFDAEKCYAISDNDAWEISKFSTEVPRRDSFKSCSDVFKAYLSNNISREVQFDTQELKYYNMPSVCSYAKITVSYVNQIYSNTCWAACISSTMKKVTGTTKSVETIAKAQYGNNFNNKASLEQCQYLMNLLYNYQYPVVSNSAPSNTTIYNNINAGYPMITKWTSASFSHAMVIHGINTDSYPTVYIMDPEVGFSSAQKGTNYFYVSSNGTGLSLSGYLSKR